MTTTRHPARPTRHPARPTKLRPTLRSLLVVAACGPLLAAACSSSSKSSTTGTGASPTTAGSGVTAPAVVNIGYTADMQVPDPDIFYELEGNSVMTSVYEGLVAYANNSTQIIPALAQSFETSADGLTYTFHLRPNVTFHDGTTMTASDAKASFMRRTSVASAPSYMLGNVTSYDTPDPLTFVIHLNMPVAPFMDYLAAPYGPKVSSAAVLTAHAGSDMAQSYLKTHDAGTGPFTMSDFVPGDHYTLSAHPTYWGGKPAVSQIKITILPDLSTQQLKLQSGDLQMILHGLAKNDIASYEGNKKFQVQRFPAHLKNWLLVNQNKGIFKSLPLRNALQQAINKQQIVNDVYGKDATVSTQIYPAGELPEGMAADTPKYDPSVLANAVKGLANKTVDVAYTSDDARNQRVAELIQTELQAAGLNSTVRAMPLNVAFALPQNAGQAPDLLLTTLNPDASHPDTWVRIFTHTADNTNGALNWLLCSVPAADQAMDQGVHLTVASEIQAAYAKAGDALVANGCFDTIADVKDVVVAQAGYGNWMHQLPTVFSVEFGKLTLHS
ncbi:MAG: peptide/nickel transport system substrate-binding protein [Acidimicrobiaceae bacterium]|nr:peptide/nickel transport system substrate-binding protein [Acidimicrobiaceae bacterium]